MKTLLTTPIAIANMNDFELPRIAGIKAGEKKRTLEKKQAKRQETYLAKLADMVSEFTANYKGDDLEKAVSDYKAVDSEYIAKVEKYHAEMLDFDRQIEVCKNDISDSREQVKAFCNKYISDAVYASYINAEGCADLSDGLRKAVKALGFGKVETADDKPFQNFVNTIQVQRAIDKKSIDQHTKYLNKYTFKELVISLIADYMLKTAGLYVDDEKGITQV